MSDKYDGVERRSERPQQHPGLIQYIGFVLQALVVAIVLWAGSSIRTLESTVIRLEERSTAATAANARVETSITSINDRLNTMATSIQAITFETKSLEQRVKGLELVKERLR